MLKSKIRHIQLKKAVEKAKQMRGGERTSCVSEKCHDNHQDDVKLITSWYLIDYKQFAQVSYEGNRKKVWDSSREQMFNSLRSQRVWRELDVNDQVSYEVVRNNTKREVEKKSVNHNRKWRHFNARAFIRRGRNGFYAA